MQPDDSRITNAHYGDLVLVTYVALTQARNIRAVAGYYTPLEKGVLGLMTVGRTFDLEPTSTVRAMRTGQESLLPDRILDLIVLKTADEMQGILRKSAETFRASFDQESA